jgi:hypothetical protein
VKLLPPVVANSISPTRHVVEFHLS